MDGKGIRMERIMDRKTGRAVIIPMDHGISNGPMAGLYDMRETVDNVTNAKYRYLNGGYGTARTFRTWVSAQF